MIASNRTRTFFALLIAALMLVAAGCGPSEDYGTPYEGSVYVEAELRVAQRDPLLHGFFPTPARSYSRYTGEPEQLIEIRASLAPSERVQSVEVFDEAGQRVWSRVDFQADLPEEGGVATFTRSAEGLPASGRVIITVADIASGETREGEQALPAPTPPTSALNALSLAPGADGLLWVGTSHDGLLALRRGEGDAVESLHYPGVPLLEDEDKAYRGPQGNMIPQLARQGARGVWIGTWSRGLSHLDPGADLLDPADDVWSHFNPHPEDDCLERDAWIACEMSETVTALLPDGEVGLWVGTVNGLYYLEHGGTPADGASWHRIADGAVLSLARGAAGTLYVGMSLDIEPGEADREAWPQAEAALLVLSYGETPSDPVDDAATWTALGDATSALSLLVDGQRLWVGTDDGLYTRPLEAEVWSVYGDADLADSDIRALASAGEGALWIGAFDVCGEDGGALMRLEHDGEPGVSDRWLTYTEATGLRDADVSAILTLDVETVAFSTFNLNVEIFDEIQGKAAQEGCVEDAAPTGGDGLTLLEIGSAPLDAQDDTRFEF